MPRLFGSFFAFATAICAVAGWSLIDPGTPAAWMWSFKAEQFRQMLAIGPIVGFGFLLLGLVMAITSAGCFAARPWGWWLAVVLIGINGLTDGMRALTGDIVEGLVGLVIAGGIVLILLRPRIRQRFQS